MTNEELPKEVLEILNGRQPKEVAIKGIYKNYRGETSLRTIIPLEFHYGLTEYHKEEQWLMKVWDLDKNAFRDYALKDWKGSPEN